MKRRFSAGNGVRVAGGLFWAKGAIGTVSLPPDAVTTICGPWDEGLTRREVSALGCSLLGLVRSTSARRRWRRPGSRRADLHEGPYVAVSKSKLTQYQYWSWIARRNGLG